MTKILITILVLVLLFKVSDLILKKIKRANYLKAGKKWEGIVKELRERK